VSDRDDVFGESRNDRGDGTFSPALTLTRGARRLVFLRGGHDRGAARRDPAQEHLGHPSQNRRRAAVDRVHSDFEIRDFDVSSDGPEIVLERLQEQSDVVLLDLPGR
jgi:hypothetical protein